MAASTVILITGVTKGFGKPLLRAHLARANYTVIGTYRDSTAAEQLKTLPAGPGSRLILVKVESTSFQDLATAVKEIAAAGVDHIDIVVASAGGTAENIVPLDAVSPKEVSDVFTVNALGPLVLFQALLPLLQKAESPKWVAISSVLGSISSIAATHSFIAPSYGISKAALNWWIVAAHCANPWLMAFAVQPGFMQTDAGNRNARALGLEKAPDTVEASCNAVVALIDGATRDKSSGKLLDAVNNGGEIPW